MTPRLFPAWDNPSQEYHEALARRFPKAIEAMRHECYRYTADWMLRDGHPQQLEQMLKNPAHYWTRHIRRSKSGKETFVWSPSKKLRDIQMSAMIAFFPRAANHYVATAFRPRCSIIENAKPHRNGQSSFRIDIRDAFPTITTNHVSAYLTRKGVNKDLAWVLARLWTYRGRLEQGAPVAPEIFNAMLERLDEDLCSAVGAPYSWGYDQRMFRSEEMPYGHPLAPRFMVEYHRPVPHEREIPMFLQDHSFPGALRRIWYTRYGDDMCFSCRDDVFPAELESVIRSIVESHGFCINLKKTRRGRNGIVDLPGVVIKHGRIRPNGAYVRKVVTTWRAILPKTAEGHRAYASGFGRSGYLRVLRQHLGTRIRR